MSISEMQGKFCGIKLWAPIHEVESGALDQLKNTATLPVIFHHVAAMADVHQGYGATVGSVIAMKDAVAPSAVGVDIGCGMAAVMSDLTAKDLPDNLSEMRSFIEAVVPVGNHVREGKRENITKHPLAHNLMADFGTLCGEVQERDSVAWHQIGTLGGGNHFIEVCLDSTPEQRVWLMLHSGSRNIGKCVAEAHIKIAKKMEHNRGLIDPDLAYFLSGTPEMASYRHDLYFAQDYARINRQVMLGEAKEAISKFMTRKHRKVKWSDEPSENVQCHHNFVAEETHYGEAVFVTRKGAIMAYKDQYGIIPGSMGTRSYIVRGLGNHESFMSASLGAGRRMSRGQAKRTFTMVDLKEQLKGIECRKDAGVMDELPGAYKDIDKVMANQTDLVETVAVLKQILCVKG